MRHISLKDGLINVSFRRRPGSSALNAIDSGLRRNDEGKINQSFLNQSIGQAACRY